MRYVFHQSITAVATASGAIALVLGYSSRTVLEEVFSGLALYANEPFKKGDLIQLNNEWGYVKDISWRSITYIDMDQNYVVVPNTVVASSKIRNLDYPTKLVRRTLYLRVEYNVPPKVVVAECELAMEDCPAIADHPWNFVAFYEADEHGVKYKLHFHINHYDDWYVGSDELMNVIWYRFARKKIRFAHQRHLNYKGMNDEHRGLRGSAYDEESWSDLVERFKQVPIFEGMNADDMEELAKSANYHIMGPPERIIQAGASHPSMFIIIKGTADVFQVDESGAETHMDSMGESEVLGLMSMLTGVPQRTTIRATTEVVVWEITSESLHALFAEKPKIMESIANNMVKWQAEEEEAISAINLSHKQEIDALNKRTSSLTKRISRFFYREQGNKEGVGFNDY